MRHRRQKYALSADEDDKLLAREQAKPEKPVDEKDEGEISEKQKKKLSRTPEETAERARVREVCGLQVVFRSFSTPQIVCMGDATSLDCCSLLFAPIGKDRKRGRSMR